MDLSLSDIVNAVKRHIADRVGIDVVFAPPSRLVAQKSNDKDVVVALSIVSQQERGLIRMPYGYVDNTKREVKIRDYIIYELSFQIDIVGKGREAVKRVEELYKKLMCSIPPSKVHGFITGRLFGVIEVMSHVFPLFLEAVEDLTDLEPQDELRIARKTMTITCQCAIAYTQVVKSVLTPQLDLGLQ